MVSTRDGTPNDRQESPRQPLIVLTPCPPPVDNHDHDQESCCPFTRPIVVPPQCTDGELLETGSEFMKKLSCIAALILLASPVTAADFKKGWGAALRGDYATALKEWRPLAEQGDAKAQNQLGIMYSKGRGVPQDYTAAVNWYRRSAEQGHALAQTNLGFMYDKGRGVSRDYTAAAKWYRKAADQGNIHAQHNLGFMYSNGRGVPQDYTASAAWYRKAADQGFALAQTNLGSMYALGRGVRRNYIQAQMWWNLSAAQGDSNAFKKSEIIVNKMTPAQVAEAEKLAREWYAKFEARKAK